MVTNGIINILLLPMMLNRTKETNNKTELTCHFNLQCEGAVLLHKLVTQLTDEAWTLTVIWAAIVLA